MARRKLVLTSIIGLLAIINLWRWWPDSGTAGGTDSVSRGSGMLANDIRLQMSVTSTGDELRMKRNLFMPKMAKKRKPASTLKKPTPVKVQKSAKVLATEAANAELANVKVMGIIFRNGKGQAYIALGQKNYAVFKGEEINRRFVVDNIDTDSVILRDSKTGVTSTIPVSGQ